jgi:Xaa-Pro aminopeptidase
MHLTHLETAALRLAIARDDQAVKDAIEAFRSSLNERALMDALRYAYVLRMFVSS